MAKSAVDATEQIAGIERDEQDETPADVAACEDPDSAADVVRVGDPEDAVGGTVDPDGAAAARPRWFRPVAATLSVVVLGLAAAAIVFGVQTWQQHKADDARSAAVDAAREVAVNLTSISYKTAQQDLRRLLHSSTGQFREEFAKRTKPFTDVITRLQVVTSGKVVKAGVESIGESSARVLVATHGEVTNAQAKEPQQRDYRLRITMNKVDGSWLAGNVEFVS